MEASNENNVTYRFVLDVTKMCRERNLFTKQFPTNAKEFDEKWDEIGNDYY